MGPGDVDVLLTHLHSDHSGLAPEAVGENGWIYISAIDRASVDAGMGQRLIRWKKITQRYEYEGFPREQLAYLEQANPARAMAPPDSRRYQSLEDGQIIEAGGLRLQALLMPGHTPGQMCFWIEEHGLLLLGDHVLFDITPNIAAWPEMPDALGSYLESLDKIRAYAPIRCLPGHRGSGDLAQRVDQLKKHHQLRLEEAMQGVKDYPGAGAFQLAGHMTWKIRARNWEEFPLAQKWFAVGECMSHLDRLMVEGRIVCRQEGERNRYFAV